MHWILAFHVIFVISWFAGLFYLPRLFVYHASATDLISNQRFKVMERKLYCYIMTPAAILATLCGIWLIYLMPVLLDFGWFRGKLACVVLLWAFHLYCGKLLYNFARDKNPYSGRFFRWFNEIPTLLLITIAILAFVQP